MLSRRSDPATASSYSVMTARWMHRCSPPRCRATSAISRLSARGTPKPPAAGWLVEHGVTTDAIGRVRGPAGLDIGARTPAEIAVAIVAEMVAVRSGATGSPLADRGGPIHHDGLHAPPARYPAGPRA